MACVIPLQLQGTVIPAKFAGKYSNRLLSRSKISVKTRAATDDLRLDMVENPEGIISGEWPNNFSLLSFDDLRAYLESHVISREINPSTQLWEVMSMPVTTVTAEQTVGDTDDLFQVISGFPVVDIEQRCIGVVSKEDRDRASSKMIKIGEIMSSPAITMTADKTVMDAAALMLKKKVYRIPITKENMRVIGIVTRTDIFKALERPTQ